MAASPEAKYEYDSHIDPSLQWAGKKAGTSFTVPTSFIHIHESIKPHKIIRSVQSIGDEKINDEDVAIFHLGLTEGNGFYVVSVENSLAVKWVDFDTPTRL
jgi:hypothetical protein